jgi:hypothetical protein
MNLNIDIWKIFTLLLSTLLSSELLLRLPLRGTAKSLNQLIYKICRTLQSPKISDHWKEQVILVYARQLLGYSLLLSILLMIVVLPLLLSLWIVTESLAELLLLSMSWRFLTGVTLLTSIYLLLRTRTNA